MTSVRVPIAGPNRRSAARRSLSAAPPRHRRTRRSAAMRPAMPPRRASTPSVRGIARASPPSRSNVWVAALVRSAASKAHSAARVCDHALIQSVQHGAAQRERGQQRQIRAPGSERHAQRRPPSDRRFAPPVPPQHTAQATARLIGPERALCSGRAQPHHQQRCAPPAGGGACRTRSISTRISRYMPDARSSRSLSSAATATGPTASCAGPDPAVERASDPRADPAPSKRQYASTPASRATPSGGAARTWRSKQRAAR